MFPFYFHALFGLAFITCFPFHRSDSLLPKGNDHHPSQPSPNPLDLGTLFQCASRGVQRTGGGKPTTYPHTNIVAVLPLARFGQKTVYFTVDLTDSKRL